MESFSFGATEIIKLLNLLVLIGYFVLSIVCFIHLRKTDSSPLVKVIWVVLILFFPYIGSNCISNCKHGQKKSCKNITFGLCGTAGERGPTTKPLGWTSEGEKNTCEV